MLLLEEVEILLALRPEILADLVGQGADALIDAGDFVREPGIETAHARVERLELGVGIGALAFDGLGQSLLIGAPLLVETLFGRFFERLHLLAETADMAFVTGFVVGQTLL